MGHVAAPLLRKALQLGIVLIGISTILFFLVRLSGDPVALLAGPTASAEQVADIRASLGLDRPILMQYGYFIRDVFRLDFGTSLWYQEPALSVALQRLWPTVQIALAAVVLAIIVALPLGILAAVKSNSFVRHPLTLLALLGQSVPVFWLALMLIMVFAVEWRWLPAFGHGTLRHLVLPVVALSFLPLAKFVRLIRSGMLDVLNQDYIRTAHAKGLPGSSVVWSHGVRNALIPVVTVVGLEFSQLIGGAVITETVFSWPGIGHELIRSVTNRDYAVVQAIVFVIAIFVFAVNAVVDACYRLLDPRLRHAPQRKGSAT